MKLGVVVLAAGEGTRMVSSLPKVLHSVGGEPMVAHVLRAATPLQPQERVVVVGHGAPQVREALKDEDIAFVEQVEQLGTGHALLQARQVLEGQVDAILALYADAPLIRTRTLTKLITHHQASQATLTLLTHHAADPTGYGRIVRDGQGKAMAIVEEKEASHDQKAIAEINCGLYCIEAGWLWDALEKLRVGPQGEYYLTDLVELAAEEDSRVETMQAEDGEEIMGINDRVQLAEAEGMLRRRKLEKLMLNGVTIADPSSTYVEPSVEIGQDTVILPGSILQGRSRIGSGCTIGPYSVIRDCQIGSGCTVTFSVLEEARLEEDVRVGPFSHLRPGAHLEKGADIGNFVEVKNSHLGRGVKAGHFSYLGDATIGEGVNIGAGTVTCNFDGKTKHPTIIEEGAFIGSDTMLVAPVRVGAGARTGAGTVVNKDVPPRTVAVGVPGRIIRRLENEG